MGPNLCHRGLCCGVESSTDWRCWRQNPWKLKTNLPKIVDERNPANLLRLACWGSMNCSMKVSPFFSLVFHEVLVFHMVSYAQCFFRFTTEKKNNFSERQFSRMFTVWMQPPKKKGPFSLGQNEDWCARHRLRLHSSGGDLMDRSHRNALMKCTSEMRNRIESFQLNISTEKKLFQFMFKGKMDFQSCLL